MKETKIYLFLAFFCCMATLGCTNKLTVAEDSGAKVVTSSTSQSNEATVADAKNALGKYVLTDIHFDLDQSCIQDADKVILKKHAEVINSFVSKQITVAGHCDERGSTEYNLALGQRRAEAVSQYLITLGVAKQRIKTISYGKEKPIDTSNTEVAWTKNRRVDFTVTN